MADGSGRLECCRRDRGNPLGTSARPIAWTIFASVSLDKDVVAAAAASGVESEIDFLIIADRVKTRKQGNQGGHDRLSTWLEWR